MLKAAVIIFLQRPVSFSHTFSSHLSPQPSCIASLAPSLHLCIHLSQFFFLTPPSLLYLSPSTLVVLSPLLLKLHHFHLFSFTCHPLHLSPLPALSSTCLTFTISTCHCFYLSPKAPSPSPHLYLSKPCTCPLISDTFTSSLPVPVSHLSHLHFIASTCPALHLSLSLISTTFTSSQSAIDALQVSRPSLAAFFEDRKTSLPIWRRKDSAASRKDSVATTASKTSERVGLCPSPPPPLTLL